MPATSRRFSAPPEPCASRSTGDWCDRRRSGAPSRRPRSDCWTRSPSWKEAVLEAMMPDPIRVAAVGDVHLADDLRGRYAPLLTDISEEADALLVAGDLTQHGTLEEAEAFADEFDAADVPVLV